MTPQILLLHDRPFNPSLHTLIFTHIPKCGGTSLHETFTGIFGPRYRIFRGEPGERQGIAMLRGGGGHQRFGTNPLHARKTPLVYTTVIRKPFEQFLSFYLHIQRDPRHPLRQGWPDIVKLSPLELIDHLEKSGNGSVSNPQAGMLAPHARTATEAIDHIEQSYSLVGVLENMKPYLEGLGSMFPGVTVKPHSLNTAPRFAGFLHRMDRRLRARVEAMTEIDHVLYERIRSRGSSNLVHQ